MIQRMLASALFAGFAAGLLAALLHFVFVQKLILLAEQYETGTLVHYQGVSPDGQTDHSHEATVEPEGAAPADATGVAGVAGPAVQHQAADVPDLQRNAFTVLFFTLTFAGYGLLMVAGFALAEQFGHKVEARQALFWGLAGFAAFQLAPAMGLAPELPGTGAADLTARQIWWIGTVLATGGSVALWAFGRGAVARIAAIALVATPHLIGAPHLDGFSGVVPPELAAEFASRGLGVAMVAWLGLGGFATRLWVGKSA